MSHEIRRNNIGLPIEQGLYDPVNEHDACGFGFIANIPVSYTHLTLPTIYSV